MDGNKIQLNFLKEIFRKINPFFISGILVSALVAIPVVIVVGSFLEDTSEYFLLMRNTFLIEYISNSIFILIGTLSFTFIFGFFAAYFISLFEPNLLSSLKSYIPIFLGLVMFGMGLTITFDQIKQVF